MNTTNTSRAFITVILSTFAALLGVGFSLQAQDRSMYYTVNHPDEFPLDWAGFYQTLDEKTLHMQREYPHHLDLAFGENPKQKLDIYLPKVLPSGAPVFIFIHGGGFREGDKAHYGAVVKPLIDRGIVTVVTSYRLTGSGFHYPDQPDDIRTAIAWVYEHIAEYGGDPNGLYVGGHSAGAILSAEVGANRDWMEAAGIPYAALKGIAPISGPYDLRDRGRPGEQSAYAPTQELRERASPILHVNNPSPKAVVAVGALEAYAKGTEAFVAKLRENGTAVNYLVLEDMDHDDTALTLTSGESALTKAVLQMIEEPE